MKKKKTVAECRRSKELREHLLLLAKRTVTPRYPKTTLTDLGQRIGASKYRISAWINLGQVPPRAAAALLKLKNANPEGQQQVTLQDLTPSLF